MIFVLLERFWGRCNLDLELGGMEGDSRWGILGVVLLWEGVVGWLILLGGGGARGGGGEDVKWEGGRKEGSEVP